jgi:4-hydroxy-3-polyprenylbenzoate decarboxylase
MGEESVTALREVGRLLAYLKEPEPPKGLKDAWQNTRPLFMQVMQMAPKERKSAPCQEIVWQGSDVDLGPLAGADVLAGRCRSSHHLGA